jgi:hypothetical protein
LFRFHDEAETAEKNKELFMRSGERYCMRPHEKSRFSFMKIAFKTLKPRDEVYNDYEDNKYFNHNKDVFIISQSIIPLLKRAYKRRDERHWSQVKKIRLQRKSKGLENYKADEVYESD